MFSSSFFITLPNIGKYFPGIHFPGIHFPRNSLSKRKQLYCKQTEPLCAKVCRGNRFQHGIIIDSSQQNFDLLTRLFSNKIDNVVIKFKSFNLFYLVKLSSWLPYNCVSCALFSPARWGVIRVNFGLLSENSMFFFLLNLGFSRSKSLLDWDLRLADYGMDYSGQK